MRFIIHNSNRDRYNRIISICQQQKTRVSIGNRIGPSKIKDEYHACFRKFLKLPESRSDRGEGGGGAISAASENKSDINP